MSTLRVAFNNQARVVHALILRETRTRFGRSKLGYLWALFEPITYILVLIAIFSALGRTSPIGSVDDLPLFFLTGLIPWLMFTHSAQRTLAAVESNRALMSYPLVTAFDVVLSRVLLEMATISLVFLITLGIFFYFGYSHEIESVLGLICASVSIWLLAVGVGYMNSSIKLYLPTYDQAYNAIQRPFFFISGIFFTAESLPPQIQEVIALNPILHAVEWFRSAFFNNFESTVVDKQYLVSSAVVMLAIGLSIQRLTRKRAKQA